MNVIAPCFADIGQPCHVTPAVEAMLATLMLAQSRKAKTAPGFYADGRGGTEYARAQVEKNRAAIIFAVREGHDTTGAIAASVNMSTQGVLRVLRRMQAEGLAVETRTGRNRFGVWWLVG